MAFPANGGVVTVRNVELKEAVGVAAVVVVAFDVGVTARMNAFKVFPTKTK